MHGTFRSDTNATKTPVQALGNGSASSGSAPTIGRTAKPGVDPRTKLYTDG